MWVSLTGSILHLPIIQPHTGSLPFIWQENEWIQEAKLAWNYSTGERGGIQFPASLHLRAESPWGQSITSADAREVTWAGRRQRGRCQTSRSPRCCCCKCHTAPWHSCTGPAHPSAAKTSSGETDIQAEEYETGFLRKITPFFKTVFFFSYNCQLRRQKRLIIHPTDCRQPNK